MSRKTKRNQPNPPPQDPQAAQASQASETRRWVLGVGSVVILLIVAAVVSLKLDGQRPGAPSTAGQADPDPARQAALASVQSPTLGEASAKVHIVEFLDPACETCAAFFPLVKQVLEQNPGRIRLSVRHVAFHEGSDYVIRVLEASRRQDRYWETLEALLATQGQWAVNHTVRPNLVLPAIASVGLDVALLTADMETPETTERVRRDREDAMTLKVTATPEYFVNGRPLPSFGQPQLLTLIDEELQRAY